MIHRGNPDNSDGGVSRVRIGFLFIPRGQPVTPATPLSYPCILRSRTMYIYTHTHTHTEALEIKPESLSSSLRGTETERDRRARDSTLYIYGVGLMGWKIIMMKSAGGRSRSSISPMRARARQKAAPAPAPRNSPPRLRDWLASRPRLRSKFFQGGGRGTKEIREEIARSGRALFAGVNLDAACFFFPSSCLLAWAARG